MPARGSYPTTEDEQEEAYFPSHRKKKSVLHKRPKMSSAMSSSAVSSDTDGEEYNWTNDNSIMQSNVALIEAKLKRKEMIDNEEEDEDKGSKMINEVTSEANLKQKQEDEAKRMAAAEEEAKRQAAEEEAIRKAVAEQLEIEAKEQEEKDRLKSEEDAKRKAVAEKRKAELEEKKKEAQEKKRLEEEEKKKAIEEKRKQDAEAKKKALEEKKKLEEEQKKKDEEEKIKTEEEKKKKAAAVTKKLEEKRAQAKKAEEEKKQAEEEKKKQAELKKEESAAKQKAIAEKNLADIEAKKAEEEAAKQAAEEHLKEEMELKEKEEQEEKYARLEKIEADKKKAWDEKKAETDKKLASEKALAKDNENQDHDISLETEPAKKSEKTSSRSSSADKRKQATEQKLASEKASVEDDKSTEEDVIQSTESAKKSEKTSSRSASADKRQKAAELVNDVNSPDNREKDFIDDSKHRIETKEDLFSAIGDTSLSSGKRSKQKGRRKTAEISKEELQQSSGVEPENVIVQDDETNEIDTNLEARNSSGHDVREIEYSEMIEDVATRKGKKSRTVSRERPNESALTEAVKDTESSDTRKNKSRTASKERPKTRDVTQERVPSRASSRLEDTGTTLNEMIITDSNVEDEEAIFKQSVADSKPARSRTTSGTRSSKLDRPSSRQSETDIAQEQVISKAVKSRTSSRERPKDLPIPEEDLYSALEHRSAVVIDDEETFNLAPAKDDDATFKQSVVDSKSVRSRTSSSTKPSKMERPRSRQSETDVSQEQLEEQMMQRYANRSKFASSRTSSSEDDAVLPRPSYPGKSQKARAASGDRKKGREQGVATLQTDADMDLEERPKSSASTKQHAKNKSRTQSRERPITPKEGRPLALDISRRRSRTNSNEQPYPIEREDILDVEEDAEYEMVKKDSHPRRFRDEAALDLEEHEERGGIREPFYDQSKFDDGDEDDYQYRYQTHRDGDMMTEDEDGEPPPTEPIFDYSHGEITNGLGQTYGLRTSEQERFDEPSFEVSQQNQYGEHITDHAQFASEIEHSEDELGDKVMRSKKVSFAAENEQFNLKPEPDVKTIPGTGMYCFAPSSTHEQSNDIVDGNKVSKLQSKTKVAPKNKDLSSNEHPDTSDLVVPDEPTPIVQSTSPKAFLRQMVSFDTNKTLSRDSSKEDSRRGDSRERSNSILDTFLRRGNSQSSQASSRQESMERGGSESNGPHADGDKRAEFVAKGSEERNISGTASDPGRSKFFNRIGKKNKLKIKPTDFDDLFARGHALSAQQEDGQPSNQTKNGFDPTVGTAVPQQSSGFGTQPQTPHSPTQPPTPFAMFSQEKVFKQSQKEAGLSYEEKVMSYLDDQQQTAPFMAHKQPMEFGEDASDKEKLKADNEKQRRSRPRKKQTDHQEPGTTAEAPPSKRTPSVSKQEDIQNDQSNADNAMPSASLKASGGVVSGGPGPNRWHSYSGGCNMPVKPDNRFRMARPDLAGDDGAQRGRSLSATGNRRHMTPEEFLKNLEDFVCKAVVDQQQAQPVLKSSQDRTPSPRVPSPYGVAQEQRQGDVGATLSPYSQSVAPSLMPGRGGSPMQRIAPSPGKSYLDQASSLSPDPFQSTIEEPTSIDGAGPLPPSSTSAIETSSSIIADLTKRTLIEAVTAMPVTERKRVPSADRHIPLQLAPDPLTAHEIETPQQLRIAYPGEGMDKDSREARGHSESSIRDTDLYRRLQEGLSSIDKLVESETFKSELSRSGVDFRKYSHHLGRAEFGVLKKRSSGGNVNSTEEGEPYTDLTQKQDEPDDGEIMVGSPIQQSASATQLVGRTRFGGGTTGSLEASREPSKERPGSAMGSTRAGGGAASSTDTRTTIPGHGAKRTSKQSSRDSSIGRPDSRLSDHIPDLEPEELNYTTFDTATVKRTGSSSSRVLPVGDIGRRNKRLDDQEEEERRLQEQLDIQPHREIYEKRKEVLEEMATQKQTVKEAKGKSTRNGAFKNIVSLNMPPQLIKPFPFNR